MSQVIAKLKYLHISPRKTRLVADLIRGLPVREAEAELLLLPKRASGALLKLLRSAIANATHNFHFDPNKLFIKEIRVDKGTVLKRWWPRARGSVGKIEKKTSHVYLTLDVSEKIKQPDFIIISTKKDKEKNQKKIKTKNTKTPKIKEEAKKEDKTHKKVEGAGEKKRFFRRKSV